MHTFHILKLYGVSKRLTGTVGVWTDNIVELECDVNHFE